MIIMKQWNKNIAIPWNNTSIDAVDAIFANVLNYRIYFFKFEAMLETNCAYLSGATEVLFDTNTGLKISLY
jgi:hypothetical protein